MPDTHHNEDRTHIFGVIAGHYKRRSDPTADVQPFVGHVSGRLNNAVVVVECVRAPVVVVLKYITVSVVRIDGTTGQRVLTDVVVLLSKDCNCFLNWY